MPTPTVDHFNYDLQAWISPEGWVLPCAHPATERASALVTEAGETVRVVVELTPLADLVHVEGYVAHWSTCPNRAQFKTAAPKGE